jgi:hypothetical protein
VHCEYPLDSHVAAVRVFNQIAGLFANYPSPGHASLTTIRTGRAYEPAGISLASSTGAASEANSYSTSAMVATLPPVRRIFSPTRGIACSVSKGTRQVFPADSMIKHNASTLGSVPELLLLMTFVSPFGQIYELSPSS